MPFRFHIYCDSDFTGEPWGYHDMINGIFSKVANPPKLDNKVIPNIEFKMRQNGYVGWSFMLFT